MSRALPWFATHEEEICKYDGNAGAKHRMKNERYILVGTRRCVDELRECALILRVGVKYIHACLT